MLLILSIIAVLISLIALLYYFDVSGEKYKPAKRITSNAPLSNCISGCDFMFKVCSPRYDSYSCLKMKEVCEKNCDMNPIAAY
jgi:hypothetical protein